MTSIVRPFSTTCVFYEEGDAVGYIAALVSLTPVFIMVSLTTVLVSRRDVHTITLIIGKLLDDLLNAVLKDYIAQPRPHDTLDKYNSLYGMPSNHSQFMCFIFAYGTAWIYFSWSRRYNYIIKPLIITGIFVGTLTVMYSRIYLRYHTWEQVLIGGLIGLGTGTVWYLLTEYLFRPYIFPWVVNTWLGKFLWLRDVSTIDILLVEYEATLVNVAHAKNRLQKQQ